MNTDRSDRLLQCQDLTVRYGRRTVLDHVSISVEKGSVYALLGRNGAGKTSMVRCLLGHQKASGGEAHLFGASAWDGRERAMVRVGVVPEEPDAPPRMTADEVASFCAHLYPRWDTAGVAARMKRFQVARKVPVRSLSKGQRAQLSLALALGHQPDLLVLDDPTLGLDAVARKDLYQELLGELADRGTTVFITTHDLVGIEGIADHVGILREGRLLLDEPLEALKSRFRRVCCPDMGPEQLTDRMRTFGPLHAKSGAMGADVLLSNFDETRFEEWRGGSGFEGEVEGLSLEEIFIALADPEREVEA